MTTPLRRLDLANWIRVHTAITAALGVGWLLDAFEVTIVNNVIGAFRDLWHLTNLQASWILSVWFVGIMVGAYVFGYLADRFGRRRLFLFTLLLYGVFTLLTAFAWNCVSLMVLRLLTAVGVGAEYAAINAAISEFIPARHRGKTNAIVMTFWSLGAIMAALVTSARLDGGGERSRHVAGAVPPSGFLADRCHRDGALVLPRRGGARHAT